MANSPANASKNMGTAKKSSKKKNKKPNKKAGRIAVFVYGEDEPQEVFDVFTSSLPRGEAERVYKGITVEGDEALQKLIEDFTG